MKTSNLHPQAVLFQPPTSTLQPPTISIVIPTLNSAKTLRACLESIAMQDYPRDRMEIIIADGGSTDRTLDIISEFSITSNPHPQTFSLSPPPSTLHPPTSNIYVVPNNLKTGEAGKAAAVKHAKNDLLAFIDSDNILPSKDWLERMVEPFQDSEIIASEPIKYTYRSTDGYITRYCALLGMNDPLCFFLGNYDRYCTLTGKWTEMPHREKDKGNYLKVELDKKHLPTIGANGFLIRRSTLFSVFTPNLQPLTSNISVSASNPQSPPSNIIFPDYLFDIDVIYIQQSHRL